MLIGDAHHTFLSKEIEGFGNHNGSIAEFTKAERKRKNSFKAKALMNNIETDTLRISSTRL